MQRLSDHELVILQEWAHSRYWPAREENQGEANMYHAVRSVVAETQELRAETAESRAWAAAWKRAAKHKRALLNNAYLFAQMCYKPFGMMYNDWRKK